MKCKSQSLNTREIGNSITLPTLNPNPLIEGFTSNPVERNIKDIGVSAEDFEDLVSSGTKLAILVILHMYGSNNLKGISELLGKKEPFIIRYLKGHTPNIKGLLEQGFIELDTRASAGRGKYYKPTTKTEKVFEFLERSYNERERSEVRFFKKDDKDEGREKIIDSLKRINEGSDTNMELFQLISMISTSVNSVTAGLIQNGVDAIKKGEDPDLDFLMNGIIVQSLSTVKIANQNHLEELYRLVNTFIQDLNTLSNTSKMDIERMVENGEIEESEISHQIIHLFTVPIKIDTS